MENGAEEKTKEKGGPRANVRLSEQEYARLCSDARIRGLSVPELLREAYFEGRPTTVLMTKEDQHTIMVELIRQGNNLNQIARQANAGILTGVKDELVRIGRSLEGMTALLRGKVLRFRAAE